MWNLTERLTPLITGMPLFSSPTLPPPITPIPTGPYSAGGVSSWASGQICHLGEAFCRESLVSFWPSTFKTPRKPLSIKLRQTATVETYINEFQLLSTHTPGLSATNLLNCFISGLCDEIPKSRFIAPKTPNIICHIGRPHNFCGIVWLILEDNGFFLQCLLLCQFVPKTLKLEGFLGDQPVVVLIDGGSTHNFVQTRLAKHLSLVIQPSPYLNVYLVKFGCSSIQYLGHIVSGSGVAVDQDKIAAIQAWPIPNSVKLLRGFLGLAGYYRRFVPHFAKLARPPLTALLKNTHFVMYTTA
ncbi:hypothetical protein Tco_0592364 [Tanacetum coccineum]